MVRIPTGSFLMGSPSGEPERYDNEGPQRPVSIRYAFSMGKYEVTRGEFATFVQATGYRAAGDWRSPGFSQTDRDPVVNVGFDDAQAYVDWLKRTTGKNYRLPSEAEWEYAARGGTTTARYWGAGYADDCTYANLAELPSGCADGFKKTAPVGRYRPNGLGLYDMLGNVWEWTRDCWNSSYAGAPTDGSAWVVGDCSRRMARGASWDSNPKFARAATRSWQAVGYRGPELGFRVARTD
jgi:formylglycine-generating enzyme required for sulfatase activity